MGTTITYNCGYPNRRYTTIVTASYFQLQPNRFDCAFSVTARSLYCTTSVTVVECTSVPEVPVTVIVYVPAGVPKFEPTFGNPLPAQPLR